MPSTRPSAQKVTRSRERMRAAGLRPVQFWVPDTRLQGFALEVQRQCLALRGDAAEANALHFTEAAAGLVEGWA
ncbi:MAG: antitoxin MazE family protein [Rhodoferax sp.]|nr:antitoxin MazE family protein [Rhodoferax sp.]